MSEAPDKAQVYAKPDGRPALFIRPKYLGSDGDGYLFASEKGGIVVQTWVPEGEVAAMETWRPVLPVDIAERIEELEGQVAELRRERSAWERTMRAAVRMLNPEQAEKVRAVFRQAMAS